MDSVHTQILNHFDIVVRGHRDEQVLPPRSVRHHYDDVQIGGEIPDHSIETRKPARADGRRYSSTVRSLPPVMVGVATSMSLPTDGYVVLGSRHFHEQKRSVRRKPRGDS